MDSRFWSLLCYYYSKRSRQNITISSQELPLAARHLVLSQRQDFSDDHLPRFPITQNQQGTVEMRDEAFSSVGAKDLDASSYQVSDLEDIEFNWEDPAVALVSVYRPGIETTLSPSIFNDF